MKMPDDLISPRMKAAIKAAKKRLASVPYDERQTLGLRRYGVLHGHVRVGTKSKPARKGGKS